ncbi:hypothetical protein chiPu_0022984 [Chiloscyllium punctatum]|uniref:Uncharacterized protein n=1 Tax=Chiloscyllium punctatum TaxID=137246 RepID=A0A401T865_CHIPU|nr:hypothetical protein [Chiloscyllium punctatum]
MKKGMHVTDSFVGREPSQHPKERTIEDQREGSGDDDDGDDDGDFVNTVEKLPIDDLVKMHDQLIAGLEQCTFISEQEIVAIYSIKERLLRQKPILMGQMTLEEVF